MVHCISILHLALQKILLARTDFEKDLKSIRLIIESFQIAFREGPLLLEVRIVIAFWFINRKKFQKYRCMHRKLMNGTVKNFRTKKLKNFCS